MLTILVLKFLQKFYVPESNNSLKNPFSIGLANIHFSIINIMGPKINPENPKFLNPAYIATSVVNGCTPNCLLTNFGSISCLTVNIIKYTPPRAIPNLTLPIINCHIVHGINTVPTPKTGKISTRAIMKDNNSILFILNPIAFSIEKDKNSSTKVSIKIFP